MWTPGQRSFETTRWSLVRRAGVGEGSVAREALGTLCETYWYPLYVYVCQQGHDPEEARDLVQSFILTLLERNDLRVVRPERGRFRSYLLTSLHHFLLNHRKSERALKRGGGHRTNHLDSGNPEDHQHLDPVGPSTPETIFERTWALTVLDHVFRRIRDEWEARGKVVEFDRLKECLTGDFPPGGYDRLARDLGSTESAVKTAAHRLKRRFEQDLRAEIAETTTGGEVEEELLYLLKALQY